MSDDIVDICIDGVPWTRMSRELFDLEWEASRPLHDLIQRELAVAYADAVDSATHV